MIGKMVGAGIDWALIRGFGVIGKCAEARYRSVTVTNSAEYADLLADAEAEEEVFEPIRFGPAFEEDAGLRRGAECDASAPAPRQPDSVDQVDHVRRLISAHSIALAHEDGCVHCACGTDEDPQCFYCPEAHADHVADVVTNMLRSDADMALKTAKFQK